MVIYGVSQSSGVERRLQVERSGQGVWLSIYDHPAGVERDRIVVAGDELLEAITGGPQGGSTIEGVSSDAEPRKRLDMEVRRNEVQLRTRTESGGVWDIAVGLDDFQDALEGVVGAG